MGQSRRREKAAYKSLLQVFEKNSGVLGEIYLNRVIEWRDEYMDLRGFRSPISVRNVYNNLDDTTVDTLLAVCRRNSGVFHEYFTEKAKMLGVKKLQRYHLYAPLSLKSRYQRRFTYDKAVGIYSKHSRILILNLENLQNEFLMNNISIQKLGRISREEHFVLQ